MADGIECSGKPCEATALTHRIRLVIGPQSDRKRQVRARMPLLLSVQPKTIEPEIVPTQGGEGLVKSCEIRFWSGRVHSSKEKCVDRLWIELRSAAPIAATRAPIGSQEAHAKSKLMF